MRNAELDAATSELAKAGLKYRVEKTNGGHIAVIWLHGKKQRTQFVANSSSDWRAPLNVRANIRRMLRDDGVDIDALPAPRRRLSHLEQVLKVPVDTGAPLQERFDKLQSEVSFLTDILFDIAPAFERSLDTVRAVETGQELQVVVNVSGERLGNVLGALYGKLGFLLDEVEVSVRKEKPPTGVVVQQEPMASAAMVPSQEVAAPPMVTADVPRVPVSSRITNGVKEHVVGTREPKLTKYPFSKGTIVEAVSGNPLSMGELCSKFGVAASSASYKNLSSMLYYLCKTGAIKRHSDGGYVSPALNLSTAPPAPAVEATQWETKQPEPVAPPPPAPEPEEIIDGKRQRFQIYNFNAEIVAKTLAKKPLTREQLRAKFNANEFNANKALGMTLHRLLHKGIIRRDPNNRYAATSH